MNNYRLIATDMDDTLLNKEHLISEENKKAIIDIQKKGVKFVLASGRPTYAMIDFAKDLEMNKYGGFILGFNGGEIVDISNGETIFEQALALEDIKIIYKEAIDRELSFLFYIGDTIYANELNIYTEEEVVLTGMKYKKIENIDLIDVENTIKCMILGEPKKLTVAQKEIHEKYKEKYVVNISKPIFMEFTSKGINKGLSIQRLCSNIGLETENIICVGDSYNDMSMLEIAGLPVAVENAREELKRVSKFITTSNNHHALKTVIDEFF